MLENDEVFSNVSIVAFDTEGLNEGSITRDGNQLVYVAKPGFEGFDYFEYTIEDIDGNRSSAMVEVLVSLVSELRRKRKHAAVNLITPLEISVAPFKLLPSPLAIPILRLIAGKSPRKLKDLCYSEMPTPTPSSP